MDKEQLKQLTIRLQNEGVNGEGLSWSETWTLIAEVSRLRLALTVIGGLPDAEGVTHGAALGDRSALYARAVLGGAAPLPVEGALQPASDWECVSDGTSGRWRRVTRKESDEQSD